MTLHVGLVAPEFPPDIGGVETYSFSLAEALASIGLRVTVFTRRDRGNEPVPHGCAREPLLRLRRRLDRKLLKRSDIDAWHATNASYAWLALEDERPTVVSVHGNDFLNPYPLVARPDLRRFGPLWRWPGPLSRADTWLGTLFTCSLVRRSLPRARRILVNSRYTEQRLLDRIPACRGRTTVGLVGVGPAFLKYRPQPAIRREARRIVTVSRLAEPRKNVDRVLYALARLKDRHQFTYTVIGDGPDLPRLASLGRELGIEGRVQLTGRVDDIRLRQELSQSGLFVLASSVLPKSHEGFGIVYLEANACGTPVLAARSGGAVEAVEEGVSGFFVDQPNVDSLTKALDAYLSGALRFDEDACRQHAARFSWRRVAEAAIPWYTPPVDQPAVEAA